MTGDRLLCGCGRSCSCICDRHQDAAALRHSRQCAEHSIRPGQHLLWLGNVWTVTEYHPGIQKVTLRRGAGRLHQFTQVASIFTLARDATPCDAEGNHGE